MMSREEFDRAFWAGYWIGRDDERLLSNARHLVEESEKLSKEIRRINDEFSGAPIHTDRSRLEGIRS